MAQTKKDKKFPLRLEDKLYPFLEKEAAAKKWSVNTLINEVLNDYKNKSKKSLVVSK